MGSKQERRRENDEQAKLDKFCSYCRKVLRNANTDVLRAQARRAKRVTLFSDLCEAELDRLACPFSYGTEETVLRVAGHEVAVLGDGHAEADRELPEAEREVVLLYYFAGWNDRQIADELGCSRSTVQARRSAALAGLRESLGEGACLYDYL